jgi:glycosyltransferase involved in cell wall biosynthesis
MRGPGHAGPGHAGPGHAGPGAGEKVARVKVAFVLGTTAGGTGRHVQMLAAGCAVRGLQAEVFAPGETQRAFPFGPGVVVRTVEFTDRPRSRDGWAALRLRQLITRSGADAVHAHGLRAGALTAIALAFIPPGRRPPLVVTVHNAPPPAGVSGAIYRALERLVARGAATVLCVSADLEERMRRAGARDVGRALVPSPTVAPGRVPGAGPPAGGGPSADVGLPAGSGSSTDGGPAELGSSTDGGPAELGSSTDGGPAGPGPLGDAGGPGADEADAVRKELTGGTGRPIVLAVGRLAEQKDFAGLIDAARQWTDLDPVPLLAIAGRGPLAESLAERAAPLGPDVRFLGPRPDVPVLLAAAGVFVLPSRWEGQPLILQEALAAGCPIVASRAGGIPDLTGEDAALLVPPGDVDALAAAIRRVLTDPALAQRLAAAARDRAQALPSQHAAIDAALATYRRLTTAAPGCAPGPAA